MKNLFLELCERRIRPNKTEKLELKIDELRRSYTPNIPHNVALIGGDGNSTFLMLEELLKKGVNIKNLFIKKRKGNRLEGGFIKSFYDEKELMKLASHPNLRYIIAAFYSDKFSKDFVKKFRGRLLNIHGSLLPDLGNYGDPVAEMLKQGRRYGGVTVHYIDEGLDTGPILGQRTFGLLNGNGHRDCSFKKLVDTNYKERVIPAGAQLCANVLKYMDLITPAPQKDTLGINRMPVGKDNWIYKI